MLNNKQKKKKKNLQVVKGKGTLMKIKPRICHLVIYRFMFFCLFVLKLIANKPGLQWSSCNKFDKLILN